MVLVATPRRCRWWHRPGGFTEAAAQPEAVVGIGSNGEAPDDSRVLQVGEQPCSLQRRGDDGVKDIAEL